jgi:hypothetical protein
MLLHDAIKGIPSNLDPDSVLRNHHRRFRCFSARSLPPPSGVPGVPGNPTCSVRDGVFFISAASERIQIDFK